MLHLAITYMLRRILHSADATQFNGCDAYISECIISSTRSHIHIMMCEGIENKRKLLRNKLKLLFIQTTKMYGN